MFIIAKSFERCKYIFCPCKEQQMHRDRRGQTKFISRNKPDPNRGHLTVQIDQQLLGEVRHQVAKEGLKLYRWVEDALREHLMRKRGDEAH
jgi:hypothetical protein